MKNLFLSSTVILFVLLLVGCKNVKAGNNEISKDAKIQVAILLDTSNSMDGLIDQAKSRLWNIVNTLTTLKFKGKTPQIEIALYEYGNDGLSAADNYIRQVTPMTTDLDLISEKLFALRTNGGLEYCGAVIDEAVKKLKWSKNEIDMKLIYIAGNEPFTQGPISYKDAISGAVSNSIFVNTILCDDGRGDNDTWADGAKCGKGKYFAINHNARVRHYATPYDSKIEECNTKLNNTYISYSKAGERKKQNQMTQDQNAKSLSSANYAERVVSKSSKVYKNESWDLVDMVEEDASVLDKINSTELSGELQNKSKEEIKVIASQKKNERESIQKELSGLAQKRAAYIDEERKKEVNDSGDDLGKAINQSIVDLALLKGYEMVK